MSRRLGLTARDDMPDETHAFVEELDEATLFDEPDLVDDGEDE